MMQVSRTIGTSVMGSLIKLAGISLYVLHLCIYLLSYMNTDTHTHTFVYIHIFVFVFVCMYTHITIFMYVWMRADLYTRIYISYYIIQVYLN